MATEPPDRAVAEKDASTSAFISEGRAALVEDVEPSGGLYHVRQSQGKEPTRRTLAVTLVIVLVVLVLVGCIGWTIDGEDTDKMQNFGLIFAPIVTLVGTVLGFYFSSDEK